MAKIMIAIPTVDYVHFKFVESLTNLIHHMDEEHISHGVQFVGGSLIYLARDELSRKAIHGGYSHVLWLDSDMTFDEDCIDLFLEADKDLITGIYQTRHGKRGPTIFKTLKPKSRYDGYPDEIFPVEGCGFGCVLTTTEILNKVDCRHGSCFMPNPRFGEDLAFCEKLKDMGYEMFAHPGVKCGHIGQAIVYPDAVEQFI